MKKPSFKETISKTYKLIKEYRSSYILIILFCLLAALFNSIAPFFLGYATDSLYNSVKGKLTINYLNFYINTWIKLNQTLKNNILNFINLIDFF